MDWFRSFPQPDFKVLGVKDIFREERFLLLPYV